METLEQIDSATWETAPDSASALESGKIVFLPYLRFELSERERRFLSPSYLRDHSKNISYRPLSGELHNEQGSPAERTELLSMLRRYNSQALSLAHALCPQYRSRLTAGFASFRPAQIGARALSWRKDDTRLHIDAFPSRPSQGRRILRIFSNVNPSAPRTWRAGEPFETVAVRFVPRITQPLPGSSWLLHRLRITKDLRTPYDHMMLGIHDRMKADETYQRDSPQISFAIPPGATWCCYTDLVSHAAMSGQFALEQTFYLPVETMHDPARSPLRVLERMTGRRLA
jgi:hypothetical protein